MPSPSPGANRSLFDRFRESHRLSFVNRSPESVFQAAGMTLLAPSPGQQARFRQRPAHREPIADLERLAEKLVVGLVDDEVAAWLVQGQLDKRALVLGREQ